MDECIQMIVTGFYLIMGLVCCYWTWKAGKEGSAHMRARIKLIEKTWELDAAILACQRAREAMQVKEHKKEEEEGE